MERPAFAVLALILCFTESIAAAYMNEPSVVSQCQRITVPLCKDVLYKMTRLPNMLGHMTQEKVAEDIAHYQPLIAVKCSKNINFFICSIFTPMCSEDVVHEPIMSCRSVCLEVKRDCIKTLNNFGFDWPATLNCSNFHQGNMCMRPENDSVPEDSTSLMEVDANRPTDDATDDANYAVVKKAPCSPGYIDLSPSNTAASCAPMCHRDIQYKRRHKQFAQMWMAVWSSICFCITGFTVVTFCLDNSRFKFPERSVVYLAACYHVYSWGFILRLIIGSEQVACHTAKTGESYLISGSLDNPKCVTVFLMTYYFSTASGLWWVILGLTWTLAARLKWSNEAIESYSSYFHLFSWGIPALLSIVVLIMHKVDANELTGLCFVGNRDPTALSAFVLAPTVLSLALGCFFILSGFAALRGSVRSELRTKGSQDVNKLERLMTKIAVFSFLYVIPTLSVLACYSYHVLVLVRWPIACKTCSPQVQIYMLQLFMALIVGITTGMWISSRKTIATWRRVCVCCMGAPEKMQEQAPLVTIAPFPVPAPQPAPRANCNRGRIANASSLQSGPSGVRNYTPYYLHPSKRYQPPTVSSAAKI